MICGFCWVLGVFFWVSARLEGFLLHLVVLARVGVRRNLVWGRGDLKNSYDGVLFKRKFTFGSQILCLALDLKVRKFS